MKRPKLKPCPFCSSALIPTNSTPWHWSCAASAPTAWQTGAGHCIPKGALGLFLLELLCKQVGMNSKLYPYLTCHFLAESFRKSSSLPSGKPSFPRLCFAFLLQSQGGWNVLSVALLTQVSSFNNPFLSVTKCPSSRFQVLMLLWAKHFKRQPHPSAFNLEERLWRGREARKVRACRK